MIDKKYYETQKEKYIKKKKIGKVISIIVTFLMLITIIVNGYLN